MAANQERAHFGMFMNCPVLSYLHELSKYLSLMSGKKKYYPNNWQQYKDTDDSNFHSSYL